MQDDNEVEGAVSLWVGVANSRSALEAYLDIDYSSGDASRLSPFADDFGIEYYDEDFVDISFHDTPTKSLAELLRRCSYASLITPKFVELCGAYLPTEVNSAVLLYNFRHHGSPGDESSATRSLKLQFLGSISVEMPWPD